ncbi:BTB/POZ domain-containing protein KCTD6,BTB/POZ domain-containing protein KCTD21 [Acanthosepion pharaonis]|uniref:BTB/POZ domain-containing protein KCTD6,BTB/POZ domain-containing protein KCTD21 n=1 Tax=Acanthosepion pharaonis TaxID=158019 RepID=A0A812E3P6_ACAPH|nr:BTB/POZ domain-containing protein KCTD6,BTB/POZ domain-containing protein KCTD21 [Sepia pharaonis]
MSDSRRWLVHSVAPNSESHIPCGSGSEHKMNGAKRSKPVSLNVGGVIYTTSFLTLISYPDSMLARMFEGDLPSAKDRDGNFFIDRDGNLFRYILNYLRTRKIHLPETLVELQQLKDEVDFYQIPTLKEEVCMELARRHEESMVKLLPPNCDSDGYFLDVIEINTVKANMKSLHLIAHADVIRVLPLNPEDYAILQALMEIVKCTDYHPQKSNTGHMWYMGKGCFEIQDLNYLTRVEIAEIVRVHGARLISSSVSFSNSTETNNVQTILVMDKWHVPAYCVQKLRESCMACKALPPGRTVGFLDWNQGD